MTNKIQQIDSILNKNNGIFRFYPNWVPRSFCIPGRRLKLHPDDYYALGANRGAIVERWFASTTKADNGPGTPSDEGFSYIFNQDNSRKEKILFKEVIELKGNDVLGPEVMEEYGGWLMYSKFFDTMDPLHFHLHLTDTDASSVGLIGKPESYFFPVQLNNHSGYFPYTFFGLNPGTTKDDIAQCLKNWNRGDNGILQYSHAYPLKAGTGWDVPAGVLHAPGSLLTYEPQKSSDVAAIFQSLTWHVYRPWSMLNRDVPEEKKNDLEYLVNLIDCDLNLDLNIYRKHFVLPKPVKPIEEMKDEGYEEFWVSYKSKWFSAKELTVYPQRTVVIKDPGAYGLIVIQGHGKYGILNVEAPTMIRYGQMTNDELFVTNDVATSGIMVTNKSKNENLVILKHFGPQPEKDKNF
jgi:hypothetical protein